jgi:hypothetical protein
MRPGQFLLIFFFALATLISCTKNNNEAKAELLYQAHCARCHVGPDIGALPKSLWAERVLPDMASRMGIKEGDYDPFKGMSFEEKEIVMKAGVYPYTPLLKPEDWAILKEYILSNAPDSLAGQTENVEYDVQDHFKSDQIALDDAPGSYYTFLDYDDDTQSIRVGDFSGNLIEHSLSSGATEVLHKVNSAVVDYFEKDTISFITDVGILDPSELSSGRIFRAYDDKLEAIPEIFHRPVNNLVADFDGDGIDELVISEFGHRTGQLTLMRGLPNGNYERRILLTLPGTIRAVAEDMDKDGDLDIVAITSQGDESITILYQEEDLRFRVDRAIRFSPIYGSSWFELLDYDHDGDIDIVTVNGDNADKTYIAKPYHGLRIHLNDGQNQFTEAFFHPLNGATRFVSEDFDQDGDFDFAVISTFPDYENAPDLALVYLENQDESKFSFKPLKFEESNLSRWFLLDKGDIDADGDIDIILSAFTYTFTPVPEEFSKQWQENNVDILLLRNQLK